MRVLRSDSVTQAVLLVEAADPSASVHHLLLSGEKGVTFGANFNPDVLLRGTGFDHIAAGAANGGLLIIGVQSCLHLCTPLWVFKFFESAR